MSKKDDLLHKEFIDMVREVLGLGPLPEEPGGSRKRCPCGRKHRSTGALCARCSGNAANRWRYQTTASKEGELTCRPEL